MYPASHPDALRAPSVLVVVVVVSVVEAVAS